MPGTVPNLPPEAQKYIRALEERLELAERSLRLLPQQRGPLPGWLRAGVIEASKIFGTGFGTPGVGGMSLDMTGNVPGSSPLLRENDGTRDRVLLGNLDVYTDPAGLVSPAQQGVRVIDGGGFLVMDTIGHAGVMSVLGSFTDSAADTITSTTPTVLDSVSVSFNLARQLNVLAWYMSTASVTTTGARGGATARMFFDGVGHGPTGRWDSMNGLTGESIVHFISLAAGPHTIDFRVSVDAGGGLTWTNFQTTLDVFQLGA